MKHVSYSAMHTMKETTIFTKEMLDCPKIISVSTYQPPYTLQQTSAEALTRELFHQKIPRLERYLKVFETGDIETRYFCVPAEWHRTEHTFEERNNLYIELSNPIQCRSHSILPTKQNFFRNSYFPYRH